MRGIGSWRWVREHLQFTQVSKKKKKKESNRETKIKRGFNLLSARGSGGVTIVPAADYIPAWIAVRPAKRKDTWAPAKSSRKELITKPFKPSSAHRARRWVRQCYFTSKTNHNTPPPNHISVRNPTAIQYHLRDNTKQKNPHTGGPLPSFLQAWMPMPALARSAACELLWTAYRISWKMAAGSL